MDNFLQRLKLKDTLITELEISKDDFITAFEKNVDKSDLGFFSDSFDIFSSEGKTDIKAISVTMVLKLKDEEEPLTEMQISQKVSELLRSKTES